MSVDVKGKNVHAWKGILHALKKCQMHNMPQKRMYLGMEWDKGNDMELNNIVQNFIHRNN
jgi:hypothetical protein